MKTLDVLFGPEENDTSARLEDEVDLYFSETCVPRNSNPLVWWKTNRFLPEYADKTSICYTSNFDQ